jgi:hypothetical protein
LPDDDANKRLIARQQVLKTAKIYVADSVYDCLVLDLSETGMRITTDVSVMFPPNVRIELRTGAIWVAQLRWQRGTEAGFEFLRLDGLNDEVAVRAEAMVAALRNSGVQHVLSRLAGEDSFGSPDLRSAAETLGRAHAAFEQAILHLLKKT